MSFYRDLNSEYLALYRASENHLLGSSVYLLIMPLIVRFLNWHLHQQNCIPNDCNLEKCQLDVNYYYKRQMGA